MTGVGLVFFPAFDWCITPDHPEREERLLYTRDQIAEEGLLDLAEFREYRPRLVEEHELARPHVFVPSAKQHVTESHLVAAGGAIAAADLVLQGREKRACALVRPPGHHSMRFVHGARGFCLVNNEAVMVEHIRHKLGPKTKIAIVDTDVHHGDGTQDIYYNDPYVLHISLHQDGRTLYPGTGFMDERGGPGAYGLTVNVPLPPGTGDEGLLFVVEKLVLPILKDWKPDLIINGAGQDNHFTDPLANMEVTAQGYARLTELLQPDIVVLEGGYSVEGALPYVNVGILLALAGLDYTRVVEPDLARKRLHQSQAVTDHIAWLADELGEMWSRRAAADLEALFGRGDYFQRKRHIYYDTAGISEVQTGRIRLCSRCAGWELVESHSDRYPAATVAVLLPWNVCTSCRAEALAAYEEYCRADRAERIVLIDPMQDKMFEFTN
ncbi:MAG: histone deacetylase [Limnochordia bacterium]